MGWLLSAPRPLSASDIPVHDPDLANGERLYNAAGCFSCHKPPDGAEKPALPSGGRALKTPIGILYPTNLTPDPETGIGNWTDLDFVNAVQRGISPSGSHYIPALPYASYARMKITDVLDIKAYLESLEPVKQPAVPADLPMEQILRRGVGLWKWIGLSTSGVPEVPDRSAAWNRGAYLVRGPGHCGECHTPRTIYMTPDLSRDLAGGPHPEGDGRVPSLRDLIGRGRYKDAADLAMALEFGEVMGYDKMSSGGMAAVQTNLSKLPKEDREAIAEYLVSLK
jgi:mono/diheme cytochrome c family protein